MLYDLHILTTVKKVNYFVTNWSHYIHTLKVDITLNPFHWHKVLSQKCSKNVLNAVASLNI